VIAAMEADLFPALALKRTAMPVVPPGARSSTLNINSIHGGQDEPQDGGLPSPVVPDSCRMVIDRRFLIEEDIAEVEAEVRDLLERLRSRRPDFDYGLRELHRVLPTMTGRDAPVVDTLTRAIGQVIGREPEYVVSPGTYDQKHIDRIGKLKNCVAYGPGILELAHKPDEWVGIGDMLDSARVMGRSLIALLAPPGA
jgi:succinyl-diaminopimelate desuccinylase